MHQLSASADMTPELLSPEELDSLAIADPEINNTLEGTCFDPGRPRPQATASDDSPPPRDRIEQAPEVPPRTPTVKRRFSFFYTKSGACLRLILYHSSIRPTEPLPLLLWHHGVEGSMNKPGSNARWFQDVVTNNRCIVAVPQSRIGSKPRSNLPRLATLVEDAWHALKRLREEKMGRKFDFDIGKGLLLGGEGVGAAVASAVALRMRDDGLGMLVSGVYLSAGAYFDPDAIPEHFRPHYRSRSDERGIHAPQPLGERAKVACEVLEAADGDIKAANWASGHADMPKIYLQVCGLDVLRDDGILYAHLLAEAGNGTWLDVYPGTPHAFWHSCPGTKIAEKWEEETLRGLLWLLSSK